MVIEIIREKITVLSSFEYGKSDVEALRGICL